MRFRPSFVLLEDRSVPSGFDPGFDPEPVLPPPPPDPGWTEGPGGDITFGDGGTPTPPADPGAGDPGGDPTFGEGDTSTPPTPPPPPEEDPFGW